MRPSITALGLVAAASVLTACGSSATDPAADPSTESAAGASSAGATAAPSAQPASTPPTTTSPAPSDAADATAPAFPAGTGQQSAKNKGAWDLVLSKVRVGEHAGFDRVVVEFKGGGTPGWAAHYATTPRADGSGEVVDVHGDSFLAVSIAGVTIRKGYPKTPEDFFHGARHFAPTHGGAIEDVNVGGVFEGYSQLFLGLGGDKVPFRVFALTSPARLVIDVKHA